MRIEGTIPSSKPTPKVNRKKETGGDSFKGVLSGVSDDEMEAASLVSSVEHPQTISPLLAIQEVEEDQTIKQHVDRGHRLLDSLNEIRLGLINGVLPETTVRNLDHMVKTAREEVTDPRLHEILDEIEVRAQVELAKIDKMV